MTKPLTEQEYAAAIPACYSRQTLEEHMDMMLCWSIANGKPVGDEYCQSCDLHSANVALLEMPAEVIP